MQLQFSFISFNWNIFAISIFFGVRKLLVAHNKEMCFPFPNCWIFLNVNQRAKNDIFSCLLFIFRPGFYNNNSYLIRRHLLDFQCIFNRVTNRGTLRDWGQKHTYLKWAGNIWFEHWRFYFRPTEEKDWFQMFGLFLCLSLYHFIPRFLL